MNPTAIEMTDVGKRFGRHWVLARLNLRIQRGESVALFGGNGSGKSTLLKMIATLLSPSTGQLKILGREADRDKQEIRRKVRLLAHEKQLYGSLTVSENLRLAAGIRGVSANGHSEFETLLGRLRIKETLGRRVSKLSEGMKKRVVLARLLIGEEDADLILLDEPHPTLDEEGREALDVLIRDWRKSGKTILLASHDRERVLPYVDRLLVLQDGRILEDKRPQ